MSEFQERQEQPYAAIPIRATLSEWGSVNALVLEVHGWLAERAIPPAGPLFYRYRLIGDRTERRFDLEVGFPVAEPVEGDGRVVAGSRPAGSYAVRVHHGHPDSIAGTHLALVEWTRERGRPPVRDGEAWVGMFEYYRTDPEVEPDPRRWETELAYLVSPPR